MILFIVLHLEKRVIFFSKYSHCFSRIILLVKHKQLMCSCIKKKRKRKRMAVCTKKLTPCLWKLTKKKRICLSCHTFSVEVTFSVKRKYWFISHLWYIHYMFLKSLESLKVFIFCPSWYRLGVYQYWCTKVTFWANPINLVCFIWKYLIFN